MKVQLKVLMKVLEEPVNPGSGIDPNEDEYEQLNSCLFVIFGV